MEGLVRGACTLAFAVVLFFAALAGAAGAQDVSCSQNGSDQGFSQTVKESGDKDAEKKSLSKGKKKHSKNAGSSKKKDSKKVQAQTNNVFQLGQVEVFGNEAQSRNTTVDRIYSNQMLLLDADNVATAANLAPGVTLSFGGQRNEENIYIRGFGPQEVPIFLDGVPIYDPYFGYPPLAEFATYGISEMVISKGFTSVLYGPNTMGGAVNLITMKPQKEFEANGGSGYGSGNTYHGYMNFGTNQGLWYFEGGGSYENQDYFPLSGAFTPTTMTGPGGVLGYQGDGDRINSAFDDWQGHFKLGFTPNDTDEYAISFMRLQEQKDAPPYVGTDPNDMSHWWQWPSWEFQDLHFNSTTGVYDKTYVKTTAFYDTYDNELQSFTNDDYNVIKSPPGYSFDSFYNDYTYGASVETGTKLLSYNDIKFAFHFKDDVHNEWETTPATATTRDEDRTYSFGAEDTIDFTRKLYSIVGISYDELQTVEAPGFPLLSTNAWNPQIGLFYKLSDTATIHASVEDKSRLPTLMERYSYSLKPGLPNPYLKPERATNYEVGYKDLLLGKLSLEATAFYDNVHDFILDVPTTTPAPGGGVYYMNQNVGHIDFSGVELGVNGELFPHLKGGMNYTYLQYVNVDNSLLITDLPHNKVFAYLQYFMPVKGWSLLGSVEYDTDRYSDSGYAPAVATAYTLVNFKEIYEIYPGVTLEAGIDNLLDENWELTEGYPLAGRTFFVQMLFKY